MSKHTPGPWQAGRPDTLSTSQVTGKWIYADEAYVAIVQATDDHEATMANARLIEAAPSYYAAAQKMMASEHVGGDGWWEGFHELKAAHAIANGEGNK